MFKSALRGLIIRSQRVSCLVFEDAIRTRSWCNNVMKKGLWKIRTVLQWVNRIPLRFSNCLIVLDLVRLDWFLRYPTLWQELCYDTRYLYSCLQGYGLLPPPPYHSLHICASIREIHSALDLLMSPCVSNALERGALPRICEDQGTSVLPRGASAKIVVWYR